MLVTAILFVFDVLRRRRLGRGDHRAGLVRVHRIVSS